MTSLSHSELSCENYETVNKTIWVESLKIQQKCMLKYGILPQTTNMLTHPHIITSSPLCDIFKLQSTHNHSAEIWTYSMYCDTQIWTHKFHQMVSQVMIACHEIFGPAGPFYTRIKYCRYKTDPGDQFLHGGPNSIRNLKFADTVPPGPVL